MRRRLYYRKKLSLKQEIGDKTSVKFNGVWKTVTAVLNTKAGPNLVKTDCLSRAQAWIVVTMKATCLRSAANTHLEIKGVIRFKVQLRQKIAGEGFLVVHNLATDMILGTEYIDKNIE